MPKTRQTKRLKDIHGEARMEFDRIQSALQTERTQCLDDRRFYSISGAMWEGKLGQQFVNKPRLEVNKIKLSVTRIINEYRNNRITVDFIPKDGNTGSKLSDTCDSLYRATEQDSNADEAYDNAFEEAVGGGIGAWRLRTVYEDEYDEENEKQKVLIEPIYDADTSVYFDLNAKKYDKSDAKCCFVLYSYTQESFVEEFGESPATWPKEIVSSTEFDWATPDVVYVAEYYRVEEVKDKILIYKTLDGSEEKYKEEDFEEDESLESKLEAVGTTFDRERQVKSRRVRKYLMSGNSILVDYGYISGKNIPIVPVYGNRWFIDNVERAMGHVRLAKDAQRLKNMQMSKLAEISALSTIEKPILMPEQISGHQMMWEEDNIKDYPYLLLNPIRDVNGQIAPAGPLAYTKVPNIPPAMAALLQITEVDMKEILGNQEQGEKISANMSGKALELVQEKLDMQTYIYVSNMSKSIKRCGEIWLSIVSELYVEEGRRMKSIDSQGEMSSVELMRPFMNKDTGEIEHENDLTNAEFDVVTEVGPSTKSRRDAVIRSIMEMLKLSNDPETTQVLTNMAMMNMEGEGIQDVREFFRNKMIKMGVVQPTEEEAKELEEALANQKPDANTEFLQAAAQEAEAKAAKARADTILTITKSEQTKAETDKTKAETMETLSGIETEEQDRAINASKSMASLESSTEQNPNV